MGEIKRDNSEAVRQEPQNSRAINANGDGSGPNERELPEEGAVPKPNLPSAPGAV